MQKADDLTRDTLVSGSEINEKTGGSTIFHTILEAEVDTGAKGTTPLVSIDN
jgi:hypothetical protein